MVQGQLRTLHRRRDPRDVRRAIENILIARFNQTGDESVTETALAAQCCVAQWVTARRETDGESNSKQQCCRLLPIVAT